MEQKCGTTDRESGTNEILESSTSISVQYDKALIRLNILSLVSFSNCLQNKNPSSPPPPHHSLIYIYMQLCQVDGGWPLKLGLVCICPRINRILIILIIIRTREAKESNPHHREYGIRKFLYTASSCWLFVVQSKSLSTVFLPSSVCESTYEPKRRTTLCTTPPTYRQ